MILEYAKLGCESVQLHTFFQLPLSEYPATARLPHPAGAARAACSIPRAASSPGCSIWRSPGGSTAATASSDFLDVHARADANHPGRAARAVAAAGRALRHLGRDHARAALAGRRAARRDRPSRLRRVAAVRAAVLLGRDHWPAPATCSSRSSFHGCSALAFDSPEAVDAALRPGVRGNSFARAAIETAAWDLEAHRRNTGLAALLGERLGARPAEAVPCGVALGIPVDRSLETLSAGSRTRSPPGTAG